MLKAGRSKFLLCARRPSAHPQIRQRDLGRAASAGCIYRQGISFIAARTWWQGARTVERKLKNWQLLCPLTGHQCVLSFVLF
jgi:hypothetical protein